MNTFEITIQRKTGDRWPIVVEHTETNVLLSERSEGDFYLSTEDFQQLISLQGQSQEFGTFLGKALFKDEIRDAFVGAIKKSTESLRVLLFLEAGDRELRTLRWERLCAPIDDGWKMLALDRRTPFSHYIPAITDRLFHPIGRRDLRVLIFVASPSDSAKYQLAKFDVIASVNSVKLALGEIPCDVMAVVDGAIAPPTLDDLCLQLTNRSQKYTLLHFVSHGRLLDNGDTALYWSKADNTTEVVTATRLIERLRLVGGTNGLPHFTFLCTCESASPEAEGALGGLGQRLVRDLGMPAVIAMTDKITIKTAQVLAENFYKQLRVTGEVDLALQEATASLAERQDVTVPVLFSRLGGKPLFSDQLDRKLTNAEIQFGLERLKQIVTERAPILQSKLQELENQLITTLNTDVKAISSTVNQEREQALIALNNLSQVASDLSFHGVALGKEAPIYDSRCPFLGLYPFRTKDREFFFGREKLVAELQQKLLEHNFLAVLGASGSGKSSLVLAGLVPTLQDKYIGLNRAILTPNSNPVEQLTTTLTQVENKFAIIVVDQFEELFTLCNDQSQRQEFIQQLLEQAKLRRVVITLRADFLADCAAYPELKAMMESHQKLIGPMETAELRKSMELQAAQVGIRFELGLINTILDDLDDEPGAMPLLQHTLLELWKRRHGKWLCYEEYEAIGGVQHAIAQTADEIYHQLSVEEQEDFQNIFIRLTRLDDNPVEGEKPRDTRRRVSLDELVLGEAESHHTHELLKMLTGEGARLVIIRVNPATQLEEVEVAHEALIRHWPRLINWLAENRTNLQIREAIRQTALDWAKNQKDDSYLVHKGERLNIAQTLSEKSKFLNQQEAEYVLACVKLSDRLSQEQKQRAIRERRLIFTIGSSIVIVVVITALLAIVVKLWQREALNRALSGSEHSSLLFNENRQLKSLIEAIKAGKSLPDPDEPDPKVITALENVVYGIREKNRLVGHDAAVNSVAFDPDSEILASASTDKTIKIWDIHGKLLQTLNNFTAGVKSVSFSPNGKFLAACSEDGTIKLWNIESINDDQPKVIENPTLDQAATVTKVVFSPDSKFLAASGTDGSIKLWDLEAPDLATQEPRNFSFGDQEQQIVFSPDSQTIITVNIDNNINALNPSGWKTDLRILQLRSGNQTNPNLSILLSKTLSIRIKSAESHKPKITTVALSPDGKNLAIGDQSGHITLADLKGNIRKTLMNIQTSDEHRHGVNQIVFSPDSKTIATANEDNYVRIWHIEDGNLQEKFLGHKAEVKSVAFSPDGTTLISAGSDDLIILWSISGKILHNYSTKGAIVTSAVLSPDDKIIAFAVNNVIKLRDSTGHLLHTLEGHKYEITQVVFNPNLTQNLALVSSSKDRTIKLWDIRGNLLTQVASY